MGGWGGGQSWRITAGEFPSNAYVCALGETRDCVVVDPGLDGESILQGLAALQLQPRGVACTHGHFDHLGSAAVLQQTYGCPVWLHAEDRQTMQRSNFLLMAFKLAARIQLPAPTLLSGPDARVTVGKTALRFRHAPGHTPGSCIVELGQAWFTGDTLYARGVGLSRLPGEDAAQLRASLRGLWPDLGEVPVVLPGHGGAASGEDIKQHNAPLRAFLDETPCPDGAP